MLTLLTFATMALAEPTEIVVDLVDGTSIVEAHLTELENPHLVDYTTADEGILVGYTDEPERALESLRLNILVEHAELNSVYTITGMPLPRIFDSATAPDDVDYKHQWHMKGPTAGEWVWENTSSGKGIIVAVLDTGVTKTFDMDAERLLEGRSFIRGQSVADGHGHGTHCAATIAETTGNAVGATGLAKNATILPVKVLSDGGSGSIDGIAAGIYWAIEQNADVISMSLGGPGSSSILNDAIDEAIENGVIVVVAAGNSGGSMGWPGAYEPVISVGAVGPDWLRSPFSSYGKTLDIMAPGGNKNIKGGGVFQVTRFMGKDSLQEWQGTSMATPHVAAAVAILRAEGAPADQRVIEQLLVDGAREVPQDGKNGKGLMDVQASVGLVKELYPDAAAVADTSSFLPYPNPAGRFTYLVTFLSMATVIVLHRVYGFNRYFYFTMMATAALSSGGLYFLTELPLPSVFNGLALFMVPWLEAPEYLLGAGLSGFPLWLSPLTLVVPYFLLTPWSKTRPFVTGLVASAMSYTLLNSFFGFNELWYVGTFGSALWMGFSTLMFGGLLVTATEFNRTARDS